MGNAPGKEARSSGENPRSPASPSSSSFASATADAQARAGRSARHESSFLGMGGSSSSAGAAAGLEARKETRQEREARKLQKERAARVKERERSLKEESIDGGHLVTLGTYTGPEDFSKPVVRSLMLERRLAPFWRGLNDHSDSWTEHQLIAAAQGRPIPAPDEIPEDEGLNTPPPPPPPQQQQQQRQTSQPTPDALPVPHSRQLSDSNFLSAYTSASPSKLSPSSLPTSSSPLFRGRAKTLASLASSSRNHSQTDITPQEIQLPHEPFMNGMRIEAHLYKDVLECPICFLYYPPYLNKTRCCDQPICSECFVQIKRPDPHPPEHLDPNTPVPDTAPKPEEEGLLVSEPASCPFCVQAEFGVSYQPPPFRRGLAYAQGGPLMLRTGSAMSSGSEPSPAATPLGSVPTSLPLRRRAESLSANAPSVVTTDKVRPDWAKKLSDARAQQARRAAAATALHTAAYLMNNNGSASGSSPFSRRRRAETTGSNNSAHHSSPEMDQLMAALDSRRHAGLVRGGNGDLFPSRGSSQRATTAQDIEEIMLMEAIRQSLAAEEERKMKEEQEAARNARQEEELFRGQEETNPSSADQTAAMAAQDAAAPDTREDDASPENKGKARSSDSASASSDFGTSRLPPSMTPLAEPTSTLNTEVLASRTDAASLSNDASSGAAESALQGESLGHSGGQDQPSAVVEDSPVTANHTEASVDSTAATATAHQEKHGGDSSDGKVHAFSSSEGAH